MEIKKRRRGNKGKYLTPLKFAERVGEIEKLLLNGYSNKDVQAYGVQYSCVSFPVIRPFKVRDII